MGTKTRLLGCGTALLLILAACGEHETPLAPGDGVDADLAPEEAAAASPAGAALVSAVRFGTPQRWSSSFCRKGEICLIADFDGDRKDDAIAFNHGVNSLNQVYVARSSGTGFGPAEKWSNLFCRSTETCAVGDVNNDGKADIIAFTRGTAKDVWVALSNGSSFGAPRKWTDFFCRAGEICKVADVNRDSRADLVAFRHGVNGSNAVFVALSNGSSFGPAQLWSSHFCTATQTCEVGDVTWSSRSALIAFTRDPNNEVWVGLSTGTGFRPPEMWSLFFCRTGEVCMSEDFNGDNRYDLIAFNHGLDRANAVFVATSNGTFGTPATAFNPAAKARDYFCTRSQTCAVGDVTGDNRADVIAFTRGATPQAWVGVSLP